MASVPFEILETPQSRRQAGLERTAIYRVDPTYFSPYNRRQALRNLCCSIPVVLRPRLGTGDKPSSGPDATMDEENMTICCSEGFLREAVSATNPRHRTAKRSVLSRRRPEQRRSTRKHLSGSGRKRSGLQATYMRDQQAARSTGKVALRNAT